MKSTKGMMLAMLLFMLLEPFAIAAQEVQTMTRQNGVYVVNTTAIAADVKGFKAATPLLVHIKNNRIVKVEALPNKETKGFFNKVKTALLGKWDGMTVKQARTAEVDAVTGATLSSNAVKTNVRMALDYYQKKR